MLGRVKIISIGTKLEFKTPYGGLLKESKLGSINFLHENYDNLYSRETGCIWT